MNDSPTIGRAPPPGLVELLAEGEISIGQCALAEMISCDVIPERFIARLNPAYRKIMTALLIRRVGIGCISYMGVRDRPTVVTAIREALMDVERALA